MRNKRRAGVTLLELILALALTVILLGAIAMAIRLNLRTLDSRRSSVEEVQLARAVLRMISEDIRSAVQYEPQDFSAVEQMLDNSVASQASALAGAAGAVPAAGAPASPGGPAAGGAPGSTPGGAIVPGGPGGGSGPGGGRGGPNGNAGQSNAPNSPAAASNSPPSGPGRGGSGGGSGGGPGGGGQGGRGGNSGGGGGGGGMPVIGIPGGSPVSDGSTGSGGAPATGAAGSETTPPENIGEAVLPTSVPGLFGNRNELQIDVSRLPRLEQYQKMLGGGAVTDVPSDMKTVAYFVRAGGATPASNGFAPAGTLTSLDSTRPGLFRRELDRAVTQYAMNRGQADQLNQQGELIAPEVVGLEFRYFDGAQWLNEWDSQQVSGLPLAVEIVVAIQPGARWDGVSQGNAPPTSGAPGAAVVPPRLFRQVVRIASARPLPPEGDTTETGDTSSGGTGSSGTSGSSGMASGAGGTR